PLSSGPVRGAAVPHRLRRARPQARRARQPRAPLGAARNARGCRARGGFSRPRGGVLRHRPDPLGVWRSHDDLGSVLAAPDFVAIGHVTLDRVGDATRPGGAALYAAVTAHRLGLSVGLLTSHAGDFPLDAIPSRI